MGPPGRDSRPPGGGGLRTIEDRWHEYIGARAALLAGPVVAHIDLHRYDIMIGGGQARLIDWAWPALAARGSTPPASASG